LARFFARYLSITKPSRASAIAGATSSFHGFLPSFLCSSHSPATAPGTPLARWPVRERSVGLPSLSRNIVSVAAAGAVSRKSSARPLRGSIRTTAKPPPPMLPAVGWTTASANAVATAASAALPPDARICLPAAVASAASDTTMNVLPAPRTLRSSSGDLPASRYFGSGAATAADPASVDAASAGALTTLRSPGAGSGGGGAFREQAATQAAAAISEIRRLRDMAHPTTRMSRLRRSGRNWRPGADLAPRGATSGRTS
jgi:hypothetical protein